MAPFCQIYRGLSNQNRGMAHPFLIIMFTAFKGSHFEFLFAITAAGVAQCGGLKKSHRTSSILQIIFSFWSFEIREGIRRNQKIIVGLDPFPYQRLVYLDLFGLYKSLYRLPFKNCKITVFLFLAAEWLIALIFHYCT